MHSYLDSGQKYPCIRVEKSNLKVIPTTRVFNTEYFSKKRSKMVVNGYTQVAKLKLCFATHFVPKKCTDGQAHKTCIFLQNASTLCHTGSMRAPAAIFTKNLPRNGRGNNNFSISSLFRTPHHKRISLAFSYSYSYAYRL